VNYLLLAYFTLLYFNSLFLLIDFFLLAPHFFLVNEANGMSRLFVLTIQRLLALITGHLFSDLEEHLRPGLEPFEAVLNTGEALLLYLPGLSRPPPQAR